MRLNSVLIGSEDPKHLSEYYTKLFGKPDQVKGKNAQPGRMIWNIESPDVKGDFARLKAAGATVVRDPYTPDPAGTFWIATFSDPDDNYFQLMSTM